MSENPEFNFQQTLEWMHQATVMVSDTLCWKPTNTSPTTVVVPETVQQKIAQEFHMGVRDVDAKELIKATKKRHAGACATDRHLDYVSYHRSIVRRVADYLEKYTRVQRKGKSTMVSLTGGPGQEIHCLGADVGFHRKAEIHNYLNSLRDLIGEKEHLEFIQGIEDDITENSQCYISARKTPPTTPAVVREALEDRLLCGYHPACMLSEEVPTLWWANRPGANFLMEDEPEVPHNATCVLDWNMLQPGPINYWQHILSRFDFPKHLMAWIWKIFDDQDNKGRQAAWCYGPGNAGLSVFWKAIRDVIPTITAVLTKNALDGKSQFSEAKFYRKRFVIFSDATSRNVYQTALVKKLTGGDVADIEEKYKGSFTDVLWSRVCVYSNFYPLLDTTDNALVTRVLLFQVKELNAEEVDIEYPAKLASQVWAFLHACKEAERELCGPVSGIPVPCPPEMREEIFKHCESDVTRFAILFIRRNVFLEEGASTTEDEIWQAFRDAARKRCRFTGQQTQKELDGNREFLLRSIARAIMQLQSEDAFADMLGLESPKPILRVAADGLRQYDNVKLEIAKDGANRI